MKMGYKMGFTRYSTARELEIRSENRLILHKINKKRCTHCEIVYEDIVQHFDIHTIKKDGSYQYTGKCKQCMTLYRSRLSAHQKTDINLYVQKLIGSVKNRAMQYKIDYDLDVTFLVDMWNQQQGRCFYTNQLMNLNAATKTKTSPHIDFPSLDRLYPDRGYIKTNVVWCKWGVNRMKSNLTIDQFKNFCKLVIGNVDD